ncbi:MAG: hypothetical protein QXE78_08655 [Nitrososphaeria archaeon]
MENILYSSSLGMILAGTWTSLIMRIPSPGLQLMTYSFSKSLKLKTFATMSELIGSCLSISFVALFSITVLPLPEKQFKEELFLELLFLAPDFI